MDYLTQAKIYDFVAATLREFGVVNPHLDARHMRILTREGCYAGHVVQCEHVRVFFSEDGQVIQFFNLSHALLRAVNVRQIAA